MPKPAPLPEERRFLDESVIGAYSLAEEETTAQVRLPTLDALLHGTRLIVPIPAGQAVRKPVAGDAACAELATVLGGWSLRTSRRSSSCTTP